MFPRIDECRISLIIDRIFPRIPSINFDLQQISIKEKERKKERLFSRHVWNLITPRITILVERIEDDPTIDFDFSQRNLTIEHLGGREGEERFMKTKHRASNWTTRFRIFVQNIRRDIRNCVTRKIARGKNVIRSKVINVVANDRSIVHSGNYNKKQRIS